MHTHIEDANSKAWIFNPCQVCLVCVDEMAAALTPGFPINFSIQPFPQQGTSPNFVLLLSPSQKHLKVLSEPHSGLENPFKAHGVSMKAP